MPAKAHLLKLPDRVCQPERPSHTLCKPPMWCIIEAPHRRFYYRRGAFSTVRSVSAQCQEPPVFRKKTGGFGPSGEIRTPGILIPNLSGILFPLVYSGFRRFLICFTYSLTLLFPLFPGTPAPSVVIYVVKNASRPVFGENSPMPDGKRFSLLLAAL